MIPDPAAALASDAFDQVATFVGEYLRRRRQFADDQIRHLYEVLDLTRYVVKHHSAQIGRIVECLERDPPDFVGAAERYRSVATSAELPLAYQEIMATLYATMTYGRGPLAAGILGRGKVPQVVHDIRRQVKRFEVAAYLLSDETLVEFPGKTSIPSLPIAKALTEVANTYSGSPGPAAAESRVGADGIFDTLFRSTMWLSEQLDQELPELESGSDRASIVRVVRLWGGMWREYTRRTLEIGRGLEYHIAMLETMVPRPLT